MNKTTFTLWIDAVSQNMDQDDVVQVNLYVIFRKGR